MGLFSKLTGAGGPTTDGIQQQRLTPEQLCQDAMQYVEIYKQSGFTDYDAREKAKRRFEMAAEQGYADAYDGLSNFYTQGEPEEDLEKLNELLQIASDMGHSGATVKLALDYSDGWGVPKNEAKAVELLTREAAKGCINAAWNLADLYGNDQMGIYDPKRNFELMLKVANMNALNESDDNDVNSARYKVGTAYIDGKVVEQDVIEGLKWVSISAARMYAPALAAIAFEYVRGIYFPRNDVWAKMYYELAIDRVPAGWNGSKANYCQQLAEHLEKHPELVSNGLDAAYWYAESQRCRSEA